MSSFNSNIKEDVETIPIGSTLTIDTLMEVQICNIKKMNDDEVAEMTGITKSTLVRNNPCKRKLNRNK